MTKIKQEVGMAILEYLTRLSGRPFLWQHVTVGLLVVLAGVLAVGFAAADHSFAAVGRDCGDQDANGVHNSIANNPTSGGGCGALDPDELVTDIANGNPDDQAPVFARFGLPAGDYARFKDKAVMGVAKMNGDFLDNHGNRVMHNGWSIGRVHFSYASAYTPLGSVGSFFKSAHTDVLKQDMPVMLLFDEEGTVQTAILASCGNPATGEKVKSGATCKDLIKTPIEGKQNTFRFTTDADKFGFAQFVKFEYFLDEGDGEKLFASTKSASEPVERTFAKNATVRVKITISVPGDQQRVIVSDDCVKEVEVKQEAIFFACEDLIAQPIDNASRKFRFTVHTDQSLNVQVLSADFSVDGSMVAEGVDDRDDESRIMWDQSFDDQEHTVSAVVNFKKPDGQVARSAETCEVEIPAKKKPTSPPAKVLSIKTVAPTPPAMPVTGPSGLFGLFAGVGAAGTAGHYLYGAYRRRRHQ